MKYASNRKYFGFIEVWSNILIWANVEEDRKLLKPTQMDNISNKIDSLEKQIKDQSRKIQEQSQEIQDLKNKKDQ